MQRPDRSRSRSAGRGRRARGHRRGGRAGGDARVTVVDTTGAGDTFDAGFVAGMLRGWSLERTLALAVACGSASTRAIGGVGAQPTLDEALSLMP
ncbi:MAG: PfkB family carbohydrate kinase [Chloroflexota bacterium]